MIITAHFFMPPEYHWTRNTVSDLAAQGLKYQWIMQLGFIGFGLLLNCGFVCKFISAKKVFYPDVLIMIYGVAVLLSGVFNTEPFLEQTQGVQILSPPSRKFREIHVCYVNFPH